MFKSLEELKAKVLEVTFAQTERWIYSEHSERAREIAYILRGCDFGCQDENVCKLVSAIIGEELPDMSSEEPFYPKFTAVTPLKNPNSHGYPIGVACVVSSADRHLAVGSCGHELNHLPKRIEGVIRLATMEEIDALFNCWDVLVKVGGNLYAAEDLDLDLE